jgi:SAM-dependent methyltransferase
MNQGDQNHINNHAIRLLQMSEGFGVSRAVQLAAELGVADLLGDAPRSTDDLAAATSTHPGALYRLLRALAGVGLFTEVEPGRFGLTPAGAQLRGDHPESLRSWVMFQGLFNGVYAEAMHSLRTGEPTVPLVFGEPLFDHLHHHPEHGEIFNAAMAEHSRLTGKALAAAYDFTGVRQIVDVGGGDGSFLSAVLRANPEATGVVFDQPYLGDAAGKRIGAAGLGERCRYVGGDFLREIPSGGDVYLLKGVLHNWPDDQALVMLRNCRRAMGADGRLLLVEWVVPAGDVPHPSKFLDLAMLFVYGGRERTEQEYVALLTEAGLRISRILGSASTLNVLEVIPAGGERTPAL